MAKKTATAAKLKLKTKTEKKTVTMHGTRKTYQVPAKYGQLPNISAVIRSMAADGLTRSEITKQVPGLLYQHVRNVLLAPVSKAS